MKRIVALGFVVGFLMVMLTACNDKGKPCPEKGAREYKSGGETHVCVVAPNGGLEWQ